MKRYLILVSLCYVFCMHLSYAWNAVGHRTIAAIAWQNLDNTIKEKFLQDNKECNKYYPNMDFIESSVWMDNIKAIGVHWYDNFHYVDIPFTDDNTKLPEFIAVNAIDAIVIARNILKQKNINILDKCIAWRVLIHVIGDIHQPLHVATRVSKEYRTGDRGGNLFLLDAPYNAHNLHEYWDKAGGIFVGDTFKPAIMANIIQKEISCKNFDVLNNDPKLWVNESHDIALRFAYPKKNEFDLLYQRQVRSISVQQVAKAGCRMSEFLNKIMI